MGFDFINSSVQARLEQMNTMVHLILSEHGEEDDSRKLWLLFCIEEAVKVFIHSYLYICSIQLAGSRKASSCYVDVAVNDSDG